MEQGNCGSGALLLLMLAIAMVAAAASRARIVGFGDATQREEC